MPSFDDWKPVRRILLDYASEIEQLVGRWGEIVSPRKLEWISSQPAFIEACERIARKMASGVLRGNARSWRAAARRSSNGRQIYEALRKEMEGPVGQAVRAIINENSRLISSVPSDIAQKAAQYIGRRQREGARSEAIAEELQRKLPGVAKSRIRLIARTEVGKAESALTRVRAESLGLGWFEWLTSRDSRVRPSHKNLNGVLVAWDDLPNPDALIGVSSRLGSGAPGNFPNCRCISAALVDLDEVDWPHKVYRSGRIQRMSRAQFSRMAGMQKAA